MKLRAKYAAIWSVVAAMLALSSALPSAYGLEFPMTTSIELEIDTKALSANQIPAFTAAALYGSIDLAETPIGAIFSSEMALVSSMSLQVEMARTIEGAKTVALNILTQEYGMNQAQFECLDKLFTRESHWNYKARNPRTGAHGIPQALPAERMEIIADDWRHNPVTQIRWGLRYITIRYETPCKAWSKFQRSNYY
ncbi:MAG: hypothetical protein O3A27_03925 [Actinomycetota bacterium]|nr:hypothetical protein [Actinomycetota bacterium]